MLCIHLKNEEIQIIFLAFLVSRKSDLLFAHLMEYTVYVKYLYFRLPESVVLKLFHVKDFKLDHRGSPS